jgi:hypothetical protein
MSRFIDPEPVGIAAALGEFACRRRIAERVCERSVGTLVIRNGAALALGQCHRSYSFIIPQLQAAEWVWQPRPLAEHIGRPATWHVAQAAAMVRLESLQHRVPLRCGHRRRRLTALLELLAFLR